MGEPVALWCELDPDDKIIGGWRQWMLYLLSSTGGRGESEKLGSKWVSVLLFGYGLAHSSRFQVGRAISILSLIVLWCMSAQAQFSYIVQEGGVAITHYTPSNGGEFVTIPEKIDGLPVTSIADAAFSGSTGLAGISIPSSVTTIGAYAFLNCVSLTSMTIPHGVVNIGEGAFNSCIGLTNLTIPSSVTNIGGNAFLRCTSLTSVTIPTGLTKIERYAFAECAGLASIIIPDTVTHIEPGAFSWCVGLTGVALPSSVTTIGELAFFGCEGLKKLKIPDSVRAIGGKAFGHCTGLTTVTIPKNVTSIGEAPFAGSTNIMAIAVDAFNPSYCSVDGVLLNKEQTILVQCPATKKGDYTIPKNVIWIGSDAFSLCSGLTSITIPQRVANGSIGANAFNGCTGLMAVAVDPSNTELFSVDGVLFNRSPNYLILFPKGKVGDYEIPDTLTRLSREFTGCKNLTSVTIPRTINSIDPYAFVGCESLTAINVDPLNAEFSSVDGVLFNRNQTILIRFPEGKMGTYEVSNSVTNVGNRAFERSSLRSVTIPNSVRSIGIYAFFAAASLVSVNIPSSVTSISDNTFEWCTALETAQIPSSVRSIGQAAFSNCTNLTSAVIPTSVRSIGIHAFAHCANLTSIALPNSIDRINNGLFLQCTALTNIVIPTSVQVIGEVGFLGCTELRSISIPNSVTTIGASAFSRCAGLTNIDISRNVTFLGFGAFRECAGLSAINVDPANPAYSSDDGVLFDKTRTVLLQYPAGKRGSYFVPSTVTAIDAYGFYNSAGLTSVTIPKGATNVGVETFSGCDRLATAFFEGLPPNTGRLFGTSSAATVYYLAGTRGWGRTFQGQPTMVWTPSAELAEVGFEPPQFGFSIHWAREGTVVVEACGDLAKPVWIPVSTNTLTTGTFQITDVRADSSSARFYRLIAR